MKDTIGIAIITHCAKKHLLHCLPPLLGSPLNPKVLVVNSSSNDGTVELAQELGAETLVIPREEFNHGATRERARQALGTDIIVMMTPDAYAVDEGVIEKLIRPIIERKASVAYARQLPHHGADFFEAFSRNFNYPMKSHIRALADKKRYGIYTIFCSDSCAAYRNSALEEIGGFKPVLIAEDTFAVADLLNRHHSIAYVSEAQVHHSHKYTLKQEFARHFDTGLIRKQYAKVIDPFGNDGERGKQYVWELFQELCSRDPWMIPYAGVQTLVKWIGYRIGRMSVHAPTWWKRLCSSQDYYW